MAWPAHEEWAPGLLAARLSGTVQLANQRVLNLDREGRADLAGRLRR